MCWCTGTHVARYGSGVSFPMRLESHSLESRMSLVGGQSRTRVSQRETNWLTTEASDNHMGLDWLQLNAARRASGKRIGGYKNSLNGPT